jgi:hypothetical protein
MTDIIKHGKAAPSKESLREGWLLARYMGLCGREGRWFEPKEEK